jgi:predicted transcriptional regulator
LTYPESNTPTFARGLDTSNIRSSIQADHPISVRTEGNVAQTRTSRLREWREDAGLTLQEVADLVGVSTAMVSRVERGERTFPPLRRVEIARRLGVRVGDLFEVEELDEGIPA